MSLEIAEIGRRKVCLDMKILINSSVSLILLGAVIYQSNAFAQPQIEVSGIILGDDSQAIVNDEMVKVGDKVQGVMVKEIGSGFVRFETQTGEVLEVKAGEQAEKQKGPVEIEEDVVNIAFDKFLKSLNSSRFPERYPKIDQKYYDVRVIMGSSHVDMMPFIMEIVKYWHPKMNRIYAHYRQGFVLLSIEFKEEINARKIGKLFADKFSQIASLEGRVEILPPGTSATWYFKEGESHP